MLTFFLVKQVQWFVVKAETEEQALSDFTCPLHSVYSSGNSMVVAGPIEATDRWQANNIFNERK